MSFPDIVAGLGLLAVLAAVVVGAVAYRDAHRDDEAGEER